MKIIILDRDGVINYDSDEYIKSADEWIPIPGSLDAIARLNHAGYVVYVATNQSGIGRGLFDIETLNAIHSKLNVELQKIGGRLQAILFCPHKPEDNCDCRKPKPGLYEEVSVRSQESLKNVYVVGDSYRDIQAALAVDAKPVLVLTGKGDKTYTNYQEELARIPIFKDLSAAVDAILEEADKTE